MNTAIRTYPIEAQVATTMQRPLFEEVGRVMCAAVVDGRFRELLLSDPRAALNAGYNGEKFSFPEDLLELIYSIEAGTLAEFANQLACLFGKKNSLMESVPVKVYGPAPFRTKIRQELLQQA